MVSVEVVYAFFNKKSGKNWKKISNPPKLRNLEFFSQIKPIPRTKTPHHHINTNTIIQTPIKTQKINSKPSPSSTPNHRYQPSSTPNHHHRQLQTAPTISIGTRYTRKPYRSAPKITPRQPNHTQGFRVKFAKKGLEREIHKSERENNTISLCFLIFLFL